MKKALSILALLSVNIFLVPTLSAGQPPGESASDAWSLTQSVVSHHMFRGLELGGAAFQPAIEYNEGSLGLGIWASIPLRDKGPGQSDPEFDLYGYYAMKIAGGLTVVPGLTIYTYPEARPTNGFYRATVEPNVAFTYAIGPVQVTPKFHYDLVRKGPTFEITAGFAIPLKHLGSELDITGTAGTYKWTDHAARAEPAVKNWGDYFLFGIAAPFQINSRSNITLAWSYAKGAHNFLKQGTAPKYANPGAAGRGIMTVSYAISF